MVGCLSEFAETKNNFSACNAKSKGGRTKKLNIALLTATRAVWGSQSGGHGFNCLLDV